MALLLSDLKVCTLCREEKPRSAFYPQYQNPNSVSSRCRPCHKIASRRWLKDNPDKASAMSRRQQLKVKYGLTEADYDALLAAQGGVCAICGSAENRGRWKRLNVDHCHATGKVRGLLCNHCNSGIGYLGEDEARFRKAVDYLKNGGAK